jgi:hypothetical protein
MQVPLNDQDSDYEGGQLVWAVEGHLEVPSRPAGSATIHTAGVVHGVTAITRGVRYGLFLCELPPQKPAQQEDDEEVKLDLQYLVAGAVEQLELAGAVEQPRPILLLAESSLHCYVVKACTTRTPPPPPPPPSPPSPQVIYLYLYQKLKREPDEKSLGDSADASKRRSAARQSRPLRHTAPRDPHCSDVASTSAPAGTPCVCSLLLLSRP